MSRSRRKTMIMSYYRTCRFAKKTYRGSYRARERNKIRAGEFDAIDGYKTKYCDSWDWKAYTLYQKSDFSTARLTKDLLNGCLRGSVRVFCEVNGCTETDYVQHLTPYNVMRYRSRLMAHYFGK